MLQYSGMETDIEDTGTPVKKRRFDWLHVLMFMLLAIIVAAAATYWIITAYIFPTEFKPVRLSVKEEQSLERKLDRLGGFESPRSDQGSASGDSDLTPERYSEEGANREITLSEKEFNSLIARNTDMAKQLAVDFSGDMVSARLLVPLDPDFPFLGGKTLKVKTGVEISYGNGQPVVVLRGISIMGVPLPNAWIGGIKNIDLVREFGGEPGVWKAFADGVENIHVEEGRLVMKLKE